MKLKRFIDALNGKTRRRARTRTIVGISIGALAGTVTGIMLAPKSGRKIRRDIKHGAENRARKVFAAAHKAVKFAKEEVTSANETVAKKANNIKSHLKHAEKVAKDVLVK